MRITLPWPDKALNPNSRKHFRALAPIKAKARDDAAYLTREAAPRMVRQAIAAGDGRIELQLRFYPPDKRHRDDDNMVASFKAARDGIADGLKVNDRRFRATYHFGDPEKPGRIEVVISAPQKATSWAVPPAIAKARAA